MPVLIISILLFLIYKWAFPPRQRYWNGPIPTQDERSKNENWIAEHIAQFPTTTTVLQRAYPKAAKRARAIRAYGSLEQRRIERLINEEDYNKELEKILPLIDISADIPQSTLRFSQLKSWLRL